MNAMIFSQIYKQVVQGWQQLGKWHTRRDLWIGIIFPSLFINILMLAFPLALLQTYDRIIPNNSTQTLTILIIGVLVVITLEVILRILRNVISNWAYVREEFLTTTKLLDKLLNVKMSFYDKTKTGERLEYTSMINKFKDFYGGQIIINLLDLMFVVVFLILIGYIAGIFVVIPIIMVAILGIYTFASSQKLEGCLKARKNNDNRRVDFLIDSLTGVHTLKSLAMEALMLRRNERLQYRAADINYDVGLVNAQVQSMTSLLSQLTIILVVAFGSIVVIYGSLTIGGLAACTLLAGRVLQPVARSVSLWHRLQSVKVSEDSLKKIYDLPSENLNESGLRRVIKGKITFKNIIYTSADDEALILNDVSLTVEPNETVAFVGDSFSGKSTFFRLIMKFVDPEKGELLIDDIPIQNYALDKLRDQIVYVPQEGVIYGGTILQNISNFRPEKEEHAREIAGKLGLNRVISKLPKGFETEMSSSESVGAANGFRQLISLVRALAEEPKIVLFDRATSAIDMESEKVINSALRHYRSKFTMLMITDKPSLLGLADRVYTVRDGELKEGFYG